MAETIREIELGYGEGKDFPGDIAGEVVMAVQSNGYFPKEINLTHYTSNRKLSLSFLRDGEFESRLAKHMAETGETRTELEVPEHPSRKDLLLVLTELNRDFDSIKFREHEAIHL